MIDIKESKENYRVLGCDPGRFNFGWAIYGDYGLEEYGVLEGAESVEKLEAFAARFENLLIKKKPDACALERFHQRPGKGAVKNLEVVNLMIGEALIICRFHRVHAELYTASAHKRWTSDNFDVKKSTRKRSGKISKKYELATYKEWVDIGNEHAVDAANIAKYAHDYTLLDLRDGWNQGELHHETA